MNIYIAHSSGFDYVHELYEPIKQSALWKQHDFFLPHDAGKNIKTKDIIERFDLLVAEISYPSTGEGIELGWANTAGTRIVGLYRSGAKYSASVGFVTDELLEYSGADGLIDVLSSLVSGESRQKH